MQLILLLIFTFLTSFICIGFGKPIAVKLGLVDNPNTRKLHVGSVPLVGGIAVYVGVLIGAIVFLPISLELNIYLIAAALIVFIGALDDFYDLPVKPRIIAQVIVASLMIFGADLYLENLGNLFGYSDINLGAIGIAFTVVAVVAAINAFNMMDGIDGLVGMLSLITFLALAFLLSRVQNEWFLLPVLFISAISAYLMFNLEWPSSKFKKVFMGDAGSMLIGLTVVWLLTVGSQSEVQAFKPVTALWLIAVPLMDMAAIMVRRIRKGQSAFKPDRDHLHHIFMRAGFSARQTLFFISGIALALSIIGIFLDSIAMPEWIMLALFGFVFFIYVYAINHIWRLLRFLKRYR
ncbi:UDP-N-acetylglucosamine--undecaprenyl-phosphate N-acetylglucosaminephosphotransferase [Psychrobium sp. MM17-31]|uniref:UDP-N-acetylglucosamine--undecaprenyl-phosphate N-acetylglucosaminephosphotransferase n=1 Tax=Psychrobium sp. MM17-31 TaxID=2917758 RepID=UPI001EF734E3|nr:UDP-N-acetylglucosamine--undecaprenyl-phosphate N-acetylglucosaminephosphotransferase [Psychrobium sp. MM17-31]MCG7531160.1 UDP-N-acetylglucosamine--undecaprenyl-phosphate N-acetylglucosaminephosphotransferase [Psychrobium sp. MM17-31]